LFTGNRGVIHDPATRTLLNRRWSTKTWIICVCEFRGKRRDVMGRNTPSDNAGWTELFFMDEITALAAGHRPCFFCQRDKAKEFADCFASAFGIAKPKAGEIDARLHRERLASGGSARPLGRDELPSLPEGAMVAVGAQAYAVHNGHALPWSFQGYGSPYEFQASDRTVLLTPDTTIAVLQRGYRPDWRR
jgi:hypothetical protein